jgi:hypothetical protein
MKLSINSRYLITCLFTLTVGLSMRPVLAVDSLPGAFELDGNAEDNVPAALAGDDWDTQPKPDGSATAFTGIVSDKNGTDDIFTGGGSKTPNEIGQWAHKNSPAPPDKDNITHAYAANYNVAGKQVIYFGADLFDNNGDAELAFWFFQDTITKTATGFDGDHVDHDPYVAVKFSNGGTQANITVFEWWDACTKQMVPNGNAPLVAGDCAANNIRVVVAEGPATCDGTGGKVACAISNEVDTPAPWDYLSKDGSDFFPPTTFFEGGINIFDVFGENKCFSSFMAVTGASTSFTATAKDFAFGDFDVCSVDVTKTCENDDTSDDLPTAITYNVRGCGINDGGGTINITSLLNSINGGAQEVPADLAWYTPGQVNDVGGGLRNFDPETDCDDSLRLKQAVDNGVSLGADVSAVDLAAGAAYVYQFGETTASNGPSDEVTIDAQGTDGSDIDADMASAICPTRIFDAGLTVTKQCTADLVDAGAALEVEINVLGQVCNQGEVALTNLVLTDDSAMPASGPVTLTPASTTLAPMGETGDCTSYTGSYTPTAIPNGDTCPFADQVVVTAIAPVNSQGDGCEPLSDGSSKCTATSNTATGLLRAVDGDGDCSTGPLSPLP